MLKVAAALLLISLAAGCASAPSSLAPTRLAPMASIRGAASDVELTKVEDRNNNYTTRYRLEVGAVEYVFDDTPLQDDPGGPYRTERVSLKVDGKKISFNDVKAVTAAAKVLSVAPGKVETRYKEAVGTAVRALTWDL